MLSVFRVLSVVVRKLSYIAHSRKAINDWNSSEIDRLQWWKTGSTIVAYVFALAFVMVALAKGFTPMYRALKNSRVAGD